MQSSKELSLARKYIEETNTNIFLTGKAGTGKTTFLRNLKETSFKRMIVVAPTGVAAINAQGVTIHSFFQLDFAPFINGDKDPKKYFRFSNEKKNIIRSLDLVVIDEISMVRADVLDAIDNTLRHIRRDRRREAFGGVQMLLIGDLGQLPPVCNDTDWDMLRDYYDTPYFFSSHAWQSSQFVTISLTKVFRQSDKNFISILNHIRENRLNDRIIEELNQRSLVDYDPEFDEGYIILCTHNWQAQKINENRLAQIDYEPYTYTAKVEGDFPPSAYPNDEELVLKQGSQVMFLKNDMGEMKNRKYYNGKIGTITQINEEKIIVHCTQDDYDIEVKKYRWENYKYTLNKETNMLEEESIGTFEQYPLKLAWAITIHKSQGLTFDKVIIDSNQAFATGQVYVALSRCRTLEGVILTHTFNPESIILDNQLVDFDRQQQDNAPSEQRLKEDTSFYIQQTLLELFSFQELNLLINELSDHNNHFFFKIDAKKSESINLLISAFKKNIYEVSLKFQNQIISILHKGEDYPEDYLYSREEKAIAYFIDKMSLVNDMISLLFTLPECDDDDENEWIVEQITSLTYACEMKKKIFALLEKDFDLKSFLISRNKLLSMSENTFLSSIGKDYKHQKQEKMAKQARPDYITDDDIAELYDSLRAYRRMKAQEEDIQPFRVFNNQTLEELVTYLPQSYKELLQIKGIGKKKAEDYGEEIIEVILDYLAERAQNHDEELLE